MFRPSLTAFQFYNRELYRQLHKSYTFYGNTFPIVIRYT